MRSRCQYVCIRYAASLIPYSIFLWPRSARAALTSINHRLHPVFNLNLRLLVALRLSPSLRSVSRQLSVLTSARCALSTTAPTRLLSTILIVSPTAGLSSSAPHSSRVVLHKVRLVSPSPPFPPVLLSSCPGLPTHSPQPTRFSDC